MKPLLTRFMIVIAAIWGIFQAVKRLTAQPTGQHEGYVIRQYPRNRQLVIDAGRMARRRHIIRGLVELDVTEARERIRAHKAATGETLSFTAYVAYCLGRAVDLNRHMHAYRDWRGQLVLFDDVDVLMVVEIEVDGRKFPLPHILKAANTRSYRELHDEIRRVQTDRTRSSSASYMTYFPLIPAPVRDVFYRVTERMPGIKRRFAGTVGMTSVGMFGDGGGWGVGAPSHTLAITLGGISQKPAVIDGEIVVREFASFTIDFDHDIIDGAPAARFTQRFKDAIESGEGLDITG